MPEIVALTRELIGINTVSAESNLALAALLATHLESLGFGIERQDWAGPDGHLKVNLIARRSDTQGRTGGGLMLAGHMDTVPFRPDQKATLAATLEGSRLYGRGACDMKGGIAAMLEAASRFVGRPLKAPLTLVFTRDEEVGCLGAKALLGTGLLRSRFTIVGEPTSLRPVRMHKGYFGARVTLTGRASHSSDPASGISAIKAAVRALVAIEGLEKVLQKMPSSAGSGFFSPDHATLNVGLLHAGVARNVVPETAMFTVELRPLPGQDLQNFQTQLEKVIEVCAGKVGARSRVEWLTRDAPMHTPDTSELVRVLESRTGVRSGAVSFSTEGKEFNQAGMESVVLGPGSIAQAHQEDEWVPLEELGQAAELYADAIRTLCLG